MNKRGRLLGGVFLLAVFTVAASAAAQESRAGRFAAGVGIGLQGDTADGTAFAIGLSGDYFLSHNVSLGPLLQLGITDDLTQVGLSLQAKFTADILEIPALKPHVEAGIGFIYADLDRGRGDADDTSYLIPVGVGAEYRLGPKLALDTTLLFNFTDLDDVGDEDFFITWLVGVKFAF
jgi:hypothetical protein